MIRWSSSDARYVDNAEQRNARSEQRHALGGAPSHSECDMRSVAPHRAAICDPTAPRATYSAARYVTSLCWAPQEPTNVSTVSQIAAPQGRRGFLWSP